MTPIRSGSGSVRIFDPVAHFERVTVAAGVAVALRNAIEHVKLEYLRYKVGMY